MPTPSSARRALVLMRTLSAAPSWLEGQTNASQAPMSSENARVSVP